MLATGDETFMYGTVTVMLYTSLQVICLLQRQLTWQLEP